MVDALPCRRARAALAAVGLAVVLLMGSPPISATATATHHGTRPHAAASQSATPSPTPSGDTKPGNPPRTTGRILITAVIAIGAYYLLRRNTGIRARRRRRGPYRDAPGDDREHRDDRGDEPD